LMFRAIRVSATTLALSLVAGVAAQAMPVVFDEGFEGFAIGDAVAGFSANTAVNQTPSGRKFLGGAGQTSLGLGNGSATATLTLGGLAGHTSVNVMFDAYILQSWDGVGADGGPDRFRFVGDGTTILDTTFSNVAGKQQDFGGAGSPPRTGAAESNTLGYSFIGDTVYSFDFTFAHTDASLVLDFIGSGLQGLSDESFGIDNVRVELLGDGDGGGGGGEVPEPATLALFGLGLAGLGLARRRKRPA